MFCMMRDVERKMQQVLLMFFFLCIEKYVCSNKNSLNIPLMPMCIISKTPFRIDYRILIRYSSVSIIII